MERQQQERPPDQIDEPTDGKSIIVAGGLVLPPCAATTKKEETKVRGRTANRRIASGSSGCGAFITSNARQAARGLWRLSIRQISGRRIIPAARWHVLPIKRSSSLGSHVTCGCVPLETGKFIGSRDVCRKENIDRAPEQSAAVNPPVFCVCRRPEFHPLGRINEIPAPSERRTASS